MVVCVQVSCGGRPAGAGEGQAPHHWLTEPHRLHQGQGNNKFIIFHDSIPYFEDILFEFSTKFVNHFGSKAYQK